MAYVWINVDIPGMVRSHFLCQEELKNNFSSPTILIYSSLINNVEA